jgi:hypothetical protein
MPMPDLPQSFKSSPAQNESVLQQTGRLFRGLLAGLWPLAKLKQTLLLITGVCGSLLRINPWARALLFP